MLADGTLESGYEFVSKNILHPVDGAFEILKGIGWVGNKLMQGFRFVEDKILHPTKVYI